MSKVIHASGGDYKGFTPRGPVSPSEPTGWLDRPIPFVPMFLASTGVLGLLVAIAAIVGPR